jgi:hypothetical protein
MNAMIENTPAPKPKRTFHMKQPRKSVLRNELVAYADRLEQSAAENLRLADALDNAKAARTLSLVATFLVGALVGAVTYAVLG